MKSNTHTQTHKQSVKSIKTGQYIFFIEPKKPGKHIDNNYWEQTGQSGVNIKKSYNHEQQAKNAVFREKNHGIAIERALYQIMNWYFFQLLKVLNYSWNSCMRGSFKIERLSLSLQLYFLVLA